MTKPILIVLIILVALMHYRLFFGDNGLIQTFHLNRETRAQQSKLDEITKRNVALIKEIDSLKKGGAAIENRARSDLGMVKKGEVFYQVVK